MFVRARLSYSSRILNQTRAAHPLPMIQRSLLSQKVMGYRFKKIQGTHYGIASNMMRGLLVTLIAMGSLYAGNQTSELCMNSNQKAIQQYESSGNYAAALKLAKNSYEDLVKRGLVKEAAQCAEQIKQLEEKILKEGYLRIFFDEQGQPRENFLQFLESVGMGPLLLSENAYVQIRNWTQKNLLRQGERWQEQSDRFELLAASIKPSLQEWGFVDATLPHFTQYQGALVHGALLPRVILRFNFLIVLWEAGVRFSDLYVLGGARPLDPVEEGKDKLIALLGNDLLEMPQTECEMMRCVWNRLSLPEGMRNEVRVHFINAPMKEDPKSGKLIRPTTNDTVECWLQTKPELGAYLSVTNAPFVPRQDVVVRTLAPNEYCFDTVGAAAREDEKIIIFLDEVARLVYQTDLVR